MMDEHLPADHAAAVHGGQLVGVDDYQPFASGRLQTAGVGWAMTRPRSAIRRLDGKWRRRW